MSVYVIGSYDITDPMGYEGYVPGVVPLLQKHGAEILAADFSAVALEGRAPGVNVVLRVRIGGGGPQLVQRSRLRPRQADPAQFIEERMHRPGQGIQGAAEIASWGGWRRAQLCVVRGA